MDTSKVSADVTLRLERTIAAPPEQVFRAWIEPEALKHWFAPGNDYSVVVHAMDARVGGRYRIAMVRSPGPGGDVVSGTFREITSPKKLVFTWAWEQKSEAGETQVTVLLTPEGKGTRLVLLHERFPAAGVRDEHEKGWTGCLERLATMLQS